MAQIDPLQGKAIIEKAVGLVVQFFQLVVRKIQRSQRDEALERPVRDVGNLIVGQIQRQQLQQPFEGAHAHPLYSIISQIQLEHYRKTPERRLPQLGQFVVLKLCIMYISCLESNKTIDNNSSNLHVKILQAG